MSLILSLTTTTTTTLYNSHLQEDYSYLYLLASRRADRAQRRGAFDQEIVPVTTTVTDAEGQQRTVTVTRDEGVRPTTTLAGLAKLRAAFKPDGTTTAGTCSTTTLWFTHRFV